MNYFTTTIVSAFSIGLPALLALSRLRFLYQRYIPLILLLWVGFINETISVFSVLYYGSNLANANVYTIIEFLLLCWFYHKINFRYSNRLIVIGVIGIVAWVLDNIVLHHFWRDNSLFKLFSFLFIVYFSIDKINQLIFNGNEEPYRNTDLLFSISIFISFAYQAYCMLFTIFPMNISEVFYTKLWWILSLINILTNIVYSIAIIWIPKQPQYTLH